MCWKEKNPVVPKFSWVIEELTFLIKETMVLLINHLLGFNQIN